MLSQIQRNGPESVLSLVWRHKWEGTTLGYLGHAAVWHWAGVCVCARCLMKAHERDMETDNRTEGVSHFCVCEKVRERERERADADVVSQQQKPQWAVQTPRLLQSYQRWVIRRERERERQSPCPLSAVVLGTVGLSGKELEGLQEKGTSLPHKHLAQYLLSCLFKIVWLDLYNTHIDNSVYVSQHSCEIHGKALSTVKEPVTISQLVSNLRWSKTGTSILLGAAL